MDASSGDGVSRAHVLHYSEDTSLGRAVNYLSDWHYDGECIILHSGMVVNWQAVTVPIPMLERMATGEVDQLTYRRRYAACLGEFQFHWRSAGKRNCDVSMMVTGRQLAGGLYGYGFAAIPFNGDAIYVGGRYTQAGTTSAMGLTSISNGTWTPLANLNTKMSDGRSDRSRRHCDDEPVCFYRRAYFETIAGQTCNHIAAYDKQLANVDDARDGRRW